MSEIDTFEPGGVSQAWVDAKDALLAKHPYAKASPEQIDYARENYSNDDVNIDDNAELSDPEDGTGYWVSAWVWVGEPSSDDWDEFEEEDEAQPST